VSARSKSLLRGRPGGGSDGLRLPSQDFPANDEGEVALLDWLIALRDHPSKRDDTPIAPRTVRNVASSVRVFFADAAERKVIRRNPTAG
jgi:hypothetical protein